MVIMINVTIANPFVAATRCQLTYVVLGFLGLSRYYFRGLIINDSLKNNEDKERGWVYDALVASNSNATCISRDAFILNLGRYLEIR